MEDGSGGRGRWGGSRHGIRTCLWSVRREGVSLLVRQRHGCRIEPRTRDKRWFYVSHRSSLKLDAALCAFASGGTGMARQVDNRVLQTKN